MKASRTARAPRAQDIEICYHAATRRGGTRAANHQIAVTAAPRHSRQFHTPLLCAALPAIIRMRRSLGSDQSRSPMTRVTRAQTPPFNPQTFLREVGRGKTSLPSPNKHTIFSQGDAADAVFYIQAGKVKLTVVSQQGKEAVVAILEGGAFFGESCLAGHTVRTMTATTVEDSRLVRIDKDTMIQVLHEK